MRSGKSLKKITAWDEAAAIHILSRTLFGFTNKDIEFALSHTLDDFVDNYLLADTPVPQSPAFWVNDPSSNNSTERTRELIYWWINLMLTQGYSFREKMVLFWHNHFVSEVTKVELPQRMYWQNKLFRDYAFGNVVDLTKKVTIDPAMLIYLDGIKSTKNEPNENYARELMELFTIGIGNYTEEDIHAAARALTGWRVNGLTSYFTENRFDDSEKTFMGQTGNFNYENIVDIIFSRNETANFFCRELYKEFVYFQPDETFVTQLGDIFRNNNYEMKPVLSTLLKSTLFHSDEIRGAKIKSPVELAVACMNQFKITTPDYNYIRKVLESLQQELFSPPNVSGWDGDKKWISTITLPERNKFTDAIIIGEQGGDDLISKFDIIEFVRTFESSENAEKLIDDLIKTFIQFPISENKRTLLLDTLLQGAAVYDWSTYVENAEARLISMFKTMLRLSEYQLS